VNRPIFDAIANTWVQGAADGSSIAVTYDENRERWLLCCCNEHGDLLATSECPGRLTLDEALETAERLRAHSTHLPVYTVSGQLLGRVVECVLPRFRVELNSGLGYVWLRVDAVFGVSPVGLSLVCDEDELDKYRTEPDRPDIAGRQVVCGWCGAEIRPGDGDVAYAFCGPCHRRADVFTFPYGELAG
jgi:hypothetical protein